MKKYFILAAAALAFAACTNDEILPLAEVQQTVDDGAVRFEAYVNRPTTRAGADGILTTSSSSTNQVSLQTAGFGVFGYYTDGEPYAGNTKPNFFYNQKVSGAGWTYSPIKYWPNEFGSDAVSDEVDRLTLFAYAPWVEVDGLTGIVKSEPTTNIVSMTRNTANGDPFIKYVSTLDATNSVDLCYGVAKEAFGSSNSTVNTNTIGAGRFYVDVVKPATGDDSKIKFDFKHALAQLVVTLDAKVTNLTNGSDDVDANTRIWVRSITFSGVTQKGALNLHDGKWYDVNGVNQVTTGSITVYDGRKDGREANDEAPSETLKALNSDFVQGNSYTVNSTTYAIEGPSTPGVTKTTKNLFKNANGLSDPVFAIPTNEEMEVTIVYDVETPDKNLASVLSDGKTKGSTIENTISKKLTTLGAIIPGKCYKLALHLGMRSVDFDAEVAEWVDYAAPVDLPSNAPAYAAVGLSAALGSVTLPAAATSFDFIVNGLTADEDVSATKGGDVTGATETNGVGTSDKASSTGVAYVRATLAANTTTTNKTGTVTVAGTTSSKGGILTITQKAHALGLGFSGISGAVITFTTSSELTDSWKTAITNVSNVAVEDITDPANPVTLTVSSVSGLTATLSATPASGHTLKATITANNVEESVTFLVPAP